MALAHVYEQAQKSKPVGRVALGPQSAEDVGGFRGIYLQKVLV